MSATPVVPAVLTVVFVVTGGFSLVEYARAVANPDGIGSSPVADRAVAVLHLLMSVAMIAMAWGVGGGPTTASGMIQLGVFGLFALGFGLAATTSPTARPARLAHAVMALAMVWMVAAMPALMGSTDAAAGAAHAAHTAGSDAMAGMPGMTATAESPGAAPVGSAPGWVTGLTMVVIAALGVAALLWLVAAVSSRRPRSVVVPGAARGGGLLADGCGRSSRSASCYVLMSGGMAAMLVTML